MKNKIIGLVMVMMLAAGTAMATSTDTINVLVTPIVAEGISVTETEYDFGNVAVNTSSGATAGCTLTNSGTVGVTLKKEIYGNPAGWTAAGGPAADVYTLLVATATAKPTYASLHANCTFGALNAKTTLTNASGTGGGVLPVGSAVNLWFAIEMPHSSETSSQKTIQVRFICTKN